MATLPRPSVRSVLELPALGLVLRAGSARNAKGGDRQIRWVAVSELEDPRSFLEGGELLLSTGMRLDAEDATGLEEYVRRLVDADVAAFGLGVGLTHEEVPTALLAAAERQGLVVLEVPERTPFIAVTKAVSSMVAAQEYEDTTRAFETQRDLTRAALSARPVPSVAARLARGLSAWVVVLDPAGRVMAAAPEAARARAGALLEEQQRLRDKGLLASSAVDVEGDRVVLHPLGARGTVRGFLAVGRPEVFDRTDTSLVAVAVSLLSLAVERADVDGSAGERLHEVALSLLLEGSGQDLPLDALGWAWLRDHDVRLVRVPVARGRPSPEELSGAHRISVRRAGEIVVVAAADERLLEELAGLLRAAGQSAGGSGPTGLDAIGSAYESAGRALRAASGSAGITWQDRLGGAGLLRLVDPAAGRAFADSLLAPLDATQGRGDLLESLGAWLSRNGQWDLAAADLGVHRHTLRYRMRRVEELLGRELDDAGLRAELWYALALRR